MTRVMKYWVLVSLFSFLSLPHNSNAQERFRKEILKHSVNSVEGFPREIIAILKKHPEWLTSTYSVRSANQDTPVMTAYETKKWTLIHSDGQCKGLKEKLLTSVILNSDRNEKEIGAEKIRFDENLTFRPYFFAGAREDLGIPNHFRILGESRFELTSESGNYRVVFMPAPSLAPTSQQIPDPKKTNRNIGVRTAPLAGQEEGIREQTGLMVPRTAYLHHDVAVSQPVYLDQKFPDRLVPSVQIALMKWNQGLGVQFFKLQEERVDVDTSDCLSRDALCIVWKGAATPAWTGLVGNTVLSYDPEFARILGGVIEIENLNDGSRLIKTPKDFDQKFISRNYDLAWLASVFVKGNEFQNYLHPMPQVIVESHFLHEIGHWLGLEHNFQGSASGTAQHPSRTVMDYLPFSARRDSELGPFDLALIRFIYQNQNLDPEFRFCSDRESLGTNTLSKDPYCNPFTVGNPVEWDLLLAQYSPQGVFSRPPRDLNQERIVDLLGAFLGDSTCTPSADRTRIMNYLCSNPTVAIKVRDELRIKLNCLLEDDMSTLMSPNWINPI